MTFEIYHIDDAGALLEKHPEPSSDTIQEAEASMTRIVADHPELAGKLKIVSVDGEVLREAVSEAEQEVIAADAKRLMTESPEASNAVAVMMVARQLHALGAHHLRQIVDQLSWIDGTTVRPPHPATVDACVQAAANESSKTFEPIELLESLTQILPWLKTMVTTTATAQRAAQQKETEALASKRAKTKIPIGLRLYASTGAETVLDRDKPVVFIGATAAVQAVLTHIATTAVSVTDDEHPEGFFSVLQFAAGIDEQASPLPHWARVPWPHWQAVANSAKTLNKFIHSVLPDVMTRAGARGCDMLIVDDLALAWTGRIVMPNEVVNGGYAPFRCANAVEHLLKWSQAWRGAFVGGIPLPHGGPVTGIHAPNGEWRDLRKHAMLLEVWVDKFDNNPNQVSIRIGYPACATFTIPIEALQLPQRILTDAFPEVS